MIDSKTLLGIAIREARNRIGMTQRELAESFKISPRYLIGIEKGKKNLSYDLLCSIVSKLELQTESIFHPTMAQDRKELEKLNIMLQYCNKQELSFITAAVLAIRKCT